MRRSNVRPGRKSVDSGSADRYSCGETTKASVSPELLLLVPESVRVQSTTENGTPARCPIKTALTERAGHQLIYAQSSTDPVDLWTTTPRCGLGSERILRYRGRKWTSPAVQKAPAWDRRPAARLSSPGRPPQVTRRPRRPTPHHRDVLALLFGAHPGFRPSSPRP